MAKAAKNPVPEGVHTVTPYLVLKSCAKAIELYKEAFGATETLRMKAPGTGAIMHAEIKIGDSLVYMTDEHTQMGAFAPEHFKGSPVSMHLQVPDVDATYKRAVASGCQGVMPPADMFWGDRFGVVIDPFGHKWSMASHQWDYTPEEMEANLAKLVQQQGQHKG